MDRVKHLNFPLFSALLLVANLVQATQNDLPDSTVGTKRNLNQNKDYTELDGAATYLKEIATRPPQMREQRAIRNREPRALPEISNLYESLPPVKVNLTIRVKNGKQDKAMDRTIIRTNDQVYMNYENQGQEWLFKRNPVDPRRLSGLLVDHRKEHVLKYHDSELLNFGIASSWQDVLLLGVEPKSLEQLASTGQIETFGGIDFLHYESNTKVASQPAIEIWWSEAKALPLRIIHKTQKQEWSQEITAISWSEDSALLVDPQKRFPEYQSMDYVDWQEEYHESSHGNSGAEHGHDH